MRWIACFLAGVIAGGAFVASAFSLHVVQATDGFHVVSKRPASLDSTYVDIRNYSLRDWQSRPNLAKALVASGQGKLLVKPMVVEPIPEHWMADASMRETAAQ